MTSRTLYQRIQNLTPKQRLLLSKHLAMRSGDENGRAHSQGNQSLIAYVTGDPDDADLRSFIRKRLPDYMVPSKIVRLTEMPLLPNGKIDRKALPDANLTGVPKAERFIEPGTPVERKLAGIWKEILDLDPISVNDNFFEVGGDSIKSIQIVSKARRAGLIISSNQIFEHQTIAELARAIQFEPEVPATEPTESATGLLPLTPIQHWFFEEHQTAPHYWNQATLFEVLTALETHHIEKALRQLVEHHDALRLRFNNDSGRWSGLISQPDEGTFLKAVSLSEATTEAQYVAINNHAQSIQADFNLSDGPLFIGVHFACGPVQNDRLLLIAHHLLVDAISWRIIFEDLSALLTRSGNEPSGAPGIRTTSYKQWAIDLTNWATTDTLQDEMSFWKKQGQTADVLPTDLPVELPVRESSVQEVVFNLDAHHTQLLLKDAPGAYQTKTDELLVAALMQAFRNWADITQLTLGLERHGRQSTQFDLDLSDSVGWFTTFYPLTLKLNPKDDLASTIQSIKEQLRSVPHQGTGYGVLRYLSASDGTTLRQRPLVIFNYLGQQTTHESSILRLDEHVQIQTRDPRNERFHLLEINAFVAGEALQTYWRYSDRIHKEETIKRLIKAFETSLILLIKHCATKDAGTYTPSDFPDADLNQDDLNSLMDQLK